MPLTLSRAQTGLLLVRRCLEFETAPGSTPVRVDREGYREADGVKPTLDARMGHGCRAAVPHSAVYAGKALQDW
jgi:hypothetical protein